MLNLIVSFPNAIFIDKKVKVHKIHFGFNGPTTDETYVSYKSDIESFVEVLLREWIFCCKGY